MSVRLSLLAILDQAPCYGYQLRSEYARRTGAAPLNVGQVYTTLERLERDGLAEKRGADERGHVYWGITDDGRADVAAWLSSPSTGATRNEVAYKIALAATLPGVDAAAAVEAQRRHASTRVDALAESEASTLPETIVRAASIVQARAELAWLDDVAALLAADGGRAALPLSSERPRRGRPVRSI